MPLRSLQASPFLWEPDVDGGRAHTASWRMSGAKESLGVWHDIQGVPEPAWPQGLLGMEKALGWAQTFLSL